MGAKSVRYPAAFGASAALLIFVLPWWVPPVARAASESFNFGFNNLVASFFLGLLSCVGAFLIARGGPLVPRAIVDAVPAALTPAPATPGRAIALLAVAGAHALLVAGFWSGASSSLFGESPAFLHSADFVLMGRRPWRDFGFPYGPLMLYPPLWLASLSGLPLDAAYIAVLVLHFVIGTWMLWRLFGAFDLPEKTRVLLFVLLSVPGFNLTLGLSYTPLRFLLAPLGILIADRVARRDRRLALAVAIAWSAFAALVTPEMGIASAAGFAAWALAHVRAGAPRMALAALPLAVLPFAVLVVTGREYAFAIVSFGAGAYNFPLLPGAHALLYVGAMLFAMPLLLATAWRGGDRGPLAAALATAALGVAPAAMGRCDPGHLFANGMLVFALVPILLRTATPRAFRVWVGVFAVVYGAGVPLVFWNHYGERVVATWKTRARYEADGFSPWVNRRRFWQPNFGDSPFLRAKMPPPNLALSRLEKYPKVGTPVSFTEDLIVYLKLTDRYVPERVPPPLLGILNEQQLAWKLEDLETMEVLLFPEPFRRFADIGDDALAAERSEFLSKLVLLPVRLRYREDPFTPERIVVRRILERYEPVDRIWNYDVMVRKQDEAP